MIPYLLSAALALTQLSTSGYRHETPLRNTIRLSVTTDRAVYYPGEPISIKVEAMNVAASPATGYLSFSTADSGFTLLHAGPGADLHALSGLVDPRAHWATRPRTLQPGDSSEATLIVAVTDPWKRPQVGEAILSGIGVHTFKVLYADTSNDPNGVLESDTVSVEVVSPEGDEGLAAEAFTPGLSYITQLDWGEGFLPLPLQLAAEDFVRRFPQSRYTHPLKLRLRAWLNYRNQMQWTNDEEKARLYRLSGGDSVAPTLMVSSTPSVLWPPNKELFSVSVNLTASDDSGTMPAVKLVSITCDDACNPAADIAEAAFGTDDRAFKLRADRKGGGSGRTYTITYEATDAAGNKTSATTTVIVPHDKGKK